MIKVDTQHQFDWLTVEPENWPRQYAQLPGKCGSCGFEVHGTFITNARGPWEHFTCAETAYCAVHDTHTMRRGKQRDLIEVLHDNPERYYRVRYVPNRKRDEHYDWERLG